MYDLPAPRAGADDLLRLAKQYEPTVASAVMQLRENAFNERTRRTSVRLVPPDVVDFGQYNLWWKLVADELKGTPYRLSQTEVFRDGGRIRCLTFCDGGVP